MAPKDAGGYVSERPKRPKRPESNGGAVFELDVFRTLPDIPMADSPTPRKAPKAARRARLTQELIDALEPEDRQFYVWDIKRKGLGVRVGASGTIAYVMKLNLPGKRSKWLTLDAHNLEEAGIEYHETLTKFGKRQALPKRQADVLWQDVVDRFQVDHIGTDESPKLKRTTRETYKSALKLIRSAFKDRPVKTIDYGDVRTFHESLADRPRQANVCVSLCGLILDRCEPWGLRPLGSNPVDLLRKTSWKPYPEQERQRPLDDDELGRIGDALVALANVRNQRGELKESQYPIAAVRLLLLTGKRLREILDLRWDQIDLDHRTIRWTDTKTGNMTAPLNDAALEVLQGLTRIEGNPFVLPGQGNPRKPNQGPQPIHDLRKFWARLLRLAKVSDLRRHDLRHAHGNEAAGLGLNLQVVAKLLGHHDAHTSARYSKAGEHPALAASQQVSGSLARKLKGEK